MKKELHLIANRVNYGTKIVRFAIMMIISAMIIFSAMPIVFAKCTRPTYSQDINYSTRLCGENFVVASGMIISKDNVNIDCSSAVLKGNLFSNSAGLIIEDRKNISISDCRIVNYKVGILVRNSSNILLDKITFLRNGIGVKLFNSFNVSISKGFDISLEKPLHLSNSSSNNFFYFNKKIVGDFCKFNFCRK